MEMILNVIKELFLRKDIMTTVKPISSPSPHIYLNKRSSVSEHLNPLKEQSSVAEYSIKYPPDKIYSSQIKFHCPCIHCLVNVSDSHCNI